MNISGIRPYAGFYEYNSIKLNEIRQQQIVQSQSLEADAGAGNRSNAQDGNADLYAARERQTYNSADYAKEYQSGVSYELKGADSDLNSLDVEKALSGLEKDQVQKQYQFFVGDDITVGNMTKASSDLVVRPEENFSLI